MLHGEFAVGFEKEIDLPMSGPRETERSFERIWRRLFEALPKHEQEFISKNPKSREANSLLLRAATEYAELGGTQFLVSPPSTASPSDSKSQPKPAPENR